VYVASGIPITMRELLDRYLAAYNLDATIVRKAAGPDRGGYDVPAIYADVAGTKQLMTSLGKRVEASTRRMGLAALSGCGCAADLGFSPQGKRLMLIVGHSRTRQPVPGRPL
jgi:hypothetical protein